MRKMIFLLSSILCLTVFKAAEATPVDVTRNFPGGDIIDRGDDQLFLSKKFNFQPPVTLESFELLELTSLFETFEIRLSDLSGHTNDESIHIEIEGNFKKFEYIFRYFDETGAEIEADRDMFSSDTGQAFATIEKDIELQPSDIFGFSEDTVVRGYELVILNRDSSSMRIDSIKLGVDASSITPTDLPTSPIPVPAPGLLLLSVAGLALLRREWTRP